MKKNDETEQILTEKFIGLNPVLNPVMNEMSRRRWAAVEARSLCYGGVSFVSRATGLSRSTITAGLAELSAESSSTSIIYATQAVDEKSYRQNILLFCQPLKNLLILQLAVIQCHP